ncbi:CDP-alcohol phosphatidyltransferase family protein [Clostridium grantii]|uniref:Phosphatidylglycerophosphate synthase n=1 Tax=Clostridium grantii DSM 8605 TaxID=1121316 RepID=A0A1M5UBW1_9CLOT|nr:CDP-alcohol phosphatidyltransferase family protein [Clostridium grantii]SHH60494.1 Phosphatidylglycerophosphate synthase [Clostridium grantii DSM 8605]
MLDTHGRKFVQPLITKTAIFFNNFGYSPNIITKTAFILGLISSIFLYFDYTILSLIILWTSGYLDAVDGTMARLQNKKSPWGTVLDVTFDRLVEISIIISLALKFPQSNFYLILLIASIVFSITVFLTVGALSINTGVKSFYYQAGFAERTEGFIFFTLMILFNKYLIFITLVFSAAIVFTAFQRLREAKKIFT